MLLSPFWRYTVIFRLGSKLNRDRSHNIYIKNVIENIISGSLKAILKVCCACSPFFFFWGGGSSVVGLRWVLIGVSGCLKISSLSTFSFRFKFDFSSHLSSHCQEKSVRKSLNRNDNLAKPALRDDSVTTSSSCEVLNQRTRSC